MDKTARKLALGMLLLFTACFCCSCWDKKELENRGFVVSIGLDKYDEEKDKEAGKEANNRFTVSMAMPDTKVIAEKSGGGDGANLTKKASAQTVAAAMNLVNVSTNKEIYYGHAKTVVIGKDFLENPDMLKDAIDALERNSEISRKIIIAAADQRGEDVLAAKADNASMIGIYISDYYKNKANSVAFTTKMDLERLVKSLRFSGCAIIPKITITEGKGKDEKGISMGGAAVIKDFRLAGWLEDEDMQGLLFFMGQGEGAQLTVNDNGIYIPMAVSSNEKKIHFSEENSKLVCNLDVWVKGSLEEYRFMEDNLLDPDKIKDLESKFDEEVTKQVYKTFDKLRDEYGVDGFGLKELLKKWNYPLYQKYSPNWDESYKNMIFACNSRTTITNTGSVK